MQLEDRKGAVEAMAFTTQYDRLLTSLVEDKAVLVRGLVLPEDNAPPKLSVQDIVPLEVAPRAEALWIWRAPALMVVVPA